jgi:hypothetical protein
LKGIAPHLLIRPVNDAVVGELVPIAHRVDAEPAIAVIDQQRSRTGDRLVSINRAHADASPVAAATLSFAPPSRQ